MVVDVAYGTMLRPLVERLSSSERGGELTKIMRINFQKSNLSSKHNLGHWFDLMVEIVLLGRY